MGFNNKYYVRDSEQDVNFFSKPVFAILLTGILIGFSIGWMTSVSTGNNPTVLFDEGLVSSIYSKTSPAVVEVRVIPETINLFSPSTQTVFGSGFLVDKEGNIVTNHHVIDNARSITVVFSDGRELPVTLMGTSRADDLAILKVGKEEVASITPLILDDSDKITTGEMVVAIGSPFGQTNSMSVGIVSGIGRNIISDLQRPIPDLIQTDAALNPGHSGGPLLNSNGRVIGINTSVKFLVDANTGVGLSVSSNTLKNILTKLITPGELRRPWIGISGVPITRQLSESLDLPSTTGIFVVRVWENSPADMAQLIGSDTANNGIGDIIIALDGNPVKSVVEMVKYLNDLQPGDTVLLTTIRDSDTKNVEVKLSPWMGS